MEAGRGLLAHLRRADFSECRVLLFAGHAFQPLLAIGVVLFELPTVAVVVFQLSVDHCLRNRSQFIRNTNLASQERPIRSRFFVSAFVFKYRFPERQGSHLLPCRDCRRVDFVFRMVAAD